MQTFKLKYGAQQEPTWDNMVAEARKLRSSGLALSHSHHLGNILFDLNRQGGPRRVVKGPARDMRGYQGGAKEEGKFRRR